MNTQTKKHYKENQQILRTNELNIIGGMTRWYITYRQAIYCGKHMYVAKLNQEYNRCTAVSHDPQKFLREGFCKLYVIQKKFSLQIL